MRTVAARDLCRRWRKRPDRGASIRTPLVPRRTDRRTRRRAGHGERKHRHTRHAHSAGVCCDRTGASIRRCAAFSALARGWSGHSGQDDDARPRHALFWHVELPPTDAQSLGSEVKPRWQQCRCGCGFRGRLWPTAGGHRHRRIDPTARQLVRRVRPEAQPWARADRSALPRARRRPDHAQRQRCSADDVGAEPTRLARPHELAGRTHRLAVAGSRSAWSAHRPDARCGLGLAVRARGLGCDHGGRSGLRGCRRHR